MTGKLAAAYIRVSTEDQTEYSPDAQMVEIRKYAGSHGYTIPDNFVFIDEGISGKRTVKRGAFNAMIGTAKQKPRPFDAILLWKFSRFARNREDSIVYKSMLRKQLGIEVISVSEPVGDDKMSILIEALIEAMDEYYSINLAEEVKRGMTEKARRGGLQTTPPFGYGVKDNVLIPVTKEAALVRTIFSRFISGEGLFPIAKGLNELGVTTHRGSQFENRTIEYILRNPVYIGKLRWNPAGRTRRDFSNENIITSDAEHEPIITEKTWNAAQKRMSDIKAQWKYHGRPMTEHRDWLSGLVRCAACGRTLIFAKPHYWKCNGYARGTCKCTQHIADERLKCMILARMEQDARPEFSVSYALVKPTPEVLDESVQLIEQQHTIRARINRLREAYLAGVESLESYSEAKTALGQQAERISRRLNEVQSPKDTTNADNMIRENIASCVALLTSTATKEEKHKAIHSIIDKCTFSKETNAITLSYRLFGDES